MELAISLETIKGNEKKPEKSGRPPNPECHEF
jgi:hypothetical protein